MNRGLLALALLAPAAGCRADSAGSRGPRLQVRWTGVDTVEFAAGAVATWCDSLKLLEIRAIAGDTGVGLVLYPPDTIEAGGYPIRRPDVADTTAPPSAALALRWFSQTAVQGWQGDSGQLMLQRGPDGLLAGRFSAAAHPITGGGRLHLTGSFERLRPAPAPPDCAGSASADSAGADTTGGEEGRADTLEHVD